MGARRKIWQVDCKHSGIDCRTFVTIPAPTDLFSQYCINVESVSIVSIDKQ